MNNIFKSNSSANSSDPVYPSITSTTGTGWLNVNDVITTDRVCRSGYARINTDNFEELVAEELLKLSNLENLCSEKGLEVEESVTLNTDNIPYAGWIFLKEKRYRNDYRNIRVTYIVKGVTELEDDAKIRIALVVKPDDVSLYISPESLDTVWQLEEFREIFYDILDRYTPDKNIDRENKRAKELADLITTKISDDFNDYRDFDDYRDGLIRDNNNLYGNYPYLDASNSLKVGNLMWLGSTDDLGKIDTSTLQDGAIICDSSNSTLNLWNKSEGSFTKFTC